ncbi:MAG: hypothetical protein HY828_11760 [Actinobacteria bacterium]|nr:hypothetical protein [Actinomycetota bacterium]
MLTEEAMAAFASHHGMATAAMLTTAGMGRRARAMAVDDGLLEVWYERVFRIRSSPVTVEARCAALCLGFRQGYITGPTGGRLSGLRRMPASPLVHFAVPHGSHIGPFDGVELRQTTKIERIHVVTRGDGIRVAAPPRLAFDLAADLSPLDHRSVIEQMLKERRTSMSTLAKVGKDLVHPARPGSARFVATLMSRAPGGAAESYPEVQIAEGLQRRGVPITLQAGELIAPGARPIRFDMSVQSVRWAVEVDVHPEHLSLPGTSSDKRRDRACHRIDWQVERVTELELLDVEGICDELAENYRLRCEHLTRRR